jgi:hypothetical protein
MVLHFQGNILYLTTLDLFVLLVLLTVFVRLLQSRSI